MATHLVTGAGAGIGECVARRLSARGDDLVLLARNETRAAELAEAFPSSRTVVADLADPAGIAAGIAAGAAGQDLPGRLDSLLHVAGTVDLGPVAELPAYSASKHGLRALADALRGEEREHGVRVTSVYPGRTATGMQAKVHAQEGKEYDPADWADPESVATTILTALDLPRDAEVTDLRVNPGPR